MGKVLVVGSDGNVIPMMLPTDDSDGDIIGILDESNNILITGDLTDGTYTLKYENEDGTYTEIGTLTVGELPQPEVIVNQIPISTSSNGELFNGDLGYKSNLRIRTSNGEEQEATDKEATGFMPIKYGQTIYIKNIESTADSYNTIALYNSNHVFIAGNYLPSFMDGVADGGNEILGEYRSQVLNTSNWKSSQGTLTEESDVAYFRLSANKIDENSIVTVNQEII